MATYYISASGCDTNDGTSALGSKLRSYMT